MTDTLEQAVTGGAAIAGGNAEYLTVTIGAQMFCLPVLQIQDVLGPQKITRIPLSPPEVAGSLNLRGRVVTAIDIRSLLGLEPGEDNRDMNVVVEYDGELYSLIVDSVGVVLQIAEDGLEKNPATLDAAMKNISAGVHRMDERLVLIMDISRLLLTCFEQAEQ